MSEYKVVANFKDLKDENHVYEIGDPYPRKGKPTKKRVEELSTKDNKEKKVFIEEVKSDANKNKK